MNIGLKKLLAATRLFSCSTAVNTVSYHYLEGNQISKKQLLPQLSPAISS